MCTVSNILIFAPVVSGEVLRVGAGVDQKIRNVNLASLSRPSPHTRKTSNNNNQFYLQDCLCAGSSQNQETLHQFDIQTTHSFFSENFTPNFLSTQKKIG